MSVRHAGEKSRAPHRPCSLAEIVIFAAGLLAAAVVGVVCGADLPAWGVS
jgi:hypothetical protein